MITGQIPKKAFERDILQSYRWRMRAALMDYPLAHYELVLMLSRHNSDSHGHALEPDLVKKMIADWRKLDFEQMKTTQIIFPGGKKLTCPPMN